MSYRVVGNAMRSVAVSLAAERDGRSEKQPKSYSANQF
jgi:hypothetical protein